MFSQFLLLPENRVPNTEEEKDLINNERKCKYLKEATIPTNIFCTTDYKEAIEGTELILRSGEATAVGNIDGDGVSDVTLGVDLKMGEKINRNHLLIVPRKDGRGIVAKTDSWIMVKGKYEIK